MITLNLQKTYEAIRSEFPKGKEKALRGQIITAVLENLTNHVSDSPKAFDLKVVFSGLDASKMDRIQTAYTSELTQLKK